MSKIQLRKDSFRVLLKRLSSVVRLLLLVAGWFSSMKVFLLLLIGVDYQQYENYVNFMNRYEYYRWINHLKHKFYLRSSMGNFLLIFQINKFTHYYGMVQIQQLIFIIIRKMMKGHSEDDITRQYTNTNSDRFSTHKLKDSNHNSQILCKITFDLDEKTQELLVYEDTSLNELTQNLVEKLKRSCLTYDQSQYQITEDDKAYLKEQIKARIQNTMDQNIQKSLQSAKWRNKLREIIEEKIRTPMDSLVSPSSHRQAPTQSKSVSYFKYNFPQGQNDQAYKQRQIIERMKTLDKEINKQTKSKDNKKNRLYDLGKQTNLLKDYLSKIHEYETKQEELSECTFHPFVKKHHEMKQHGKFEHQGQNVFKRLYNEAVQKKQKMKKIEVEVHHRQTEEYKHFNFIPQINECSKEIIKAKKDQKTSIYETLYNDVLQKEKRKFQPQWTFHPTICAKSNEIVKKNQLSKKTQKEQLCLSRQFFKDSTRRSKNETIIQMQRQGLKTENSLQKSPISRKIMSTKKLDGYKIGRASQACLKQMRNQEETLKKISYRPNIHYETESTLKQNIFSKKAFKKPNKTMNGIKQNCIQAKSQSIGNCFVDSKDIKRQKVIIADQTLETCNTEETCPLYTVNEHLYNIEEENQTKNLKNRIKREKNNKLDPFLFFQEKEKQKKSNITINNKQNLNSIKQKKQQDNNFEQQFQKRKNSIFEEIFGFLIRQSKSQKQLYYDAIIDSSTIPSSLKHIFHPMAEQMKQLNVGLDKQQFVWSMTRIFDSLTLQQRGWILAWGLKLQEPINETVKNLR